MGQVTLQVEGMTCGHCVASVEKTLRSLPGVHDARANLESGTAVVSTDDSADVSSMTAALTKAGFDATPA